MSMERRDLFKLMSVAAAAAVLPSVAVASEAKAVDAKKASGKSVVIVGGGFGGLAMAKELRKKDKSIDVTLIEKKDIFMSCPFSNSYLGGLDDVNLDTLTHDYYAPANKHGYSFVPENKKPKDFNLAMKKHYSQAKKGSFSPISAPVESYRDKVKRFWDYTSAPVRKPSFSIVKRSVGDYPLWVLEDGKILPQLFNKSDNVKSIIAKHKLPTKETVLKVESYGSGFFPRIRIDVSCGNSKLDLLALKTLALKGQNLLGFNKSNDAPVYIAIKWKISD